MKRKGTLWLLVSAAVFFALILGFYLGRNLSRDPVQVSTVSHSNAETATTAPLTTESTLLDINTAAAEDLMTLPGIGEVLAQRILSYREENGPFTSLSQLLNVEGIGQQRLSELLPYITIGG